MRNSLKDLFIGVLGVGVSIAVLVWGLSVVEHGVLKRVSPTQGIQLDDWLRDYDYVQIWWVFLPAAICALGWITYTSLADDGLRGDRRIGWLSLFVLAFLIAVYGIVFKLPETSSGGYMASVVTLLNAGFAFWLMTALTTAQTHKYAPVGSGWIRRW
jgi:hypothetical protein